MSLPLIMVGQYLGSMLGFTTGLMALLVGNLFLVSIAIPMAILSHQKKEPTGEVTKLFFGERGKLFFSLLLSLAMFGWFAIQVNIISQAILKMAGMNIPPAVLNLSIGLLITLGALKGIKFIGKIAYFSLPLFIFTLLALCYFAPVPEIGPLTLHFDLPLICMVIGAAIAGVIDMPTYFLHAKSKKDAVLAAIILFGFIVPVIELSGLYIGSNGANLSFIDSVIQNKSSFWTILISIFIVFSGWTTNNLNLYSSVVNSEKLLLKLGFGTRCFILGIAATMLSLINSDLELFLNFLGIFLSAMSGCTISSFILENWSGKKLNSRAKRLNILFFAFALLAGFLNPLTHVAALDSFLIGFLLSVMNFFNMEAENETVNG